MSMHLQSGKLEHTAHPSSATQAQWVTAEFYLGVWWWGGWGINSGTLKFHGGSTKAQTNGWSYIWFQYDIVARNSSLSNVGANLEQLRLILFTRSFP
eukprot:1036930-Amphidinium_carterae.1